MQNILERVRAGAFASIPSYPTLPIIYANQSGAVEPATTYCAISVIDNRSVGRTSINSYADDLYETTISHVKQMRVQFMFIGSDSASVVGEFDNLITSFHSVQAYSALEIGVLNKTQVRRSPQKRETEWVEGYSIDVTFNYVQGITVGTEIIEKVQIEFSSQASTLNIPD